MAWITGTVVTMARRGAGGPADEQLALTPDGDLWLWVRRPLDAARGDLVGSFRAAAPAGIRHDLERLAGAVVAGPGPAGPDALAEVATAAGTALVGPGDGPDAAALLALLDAATEVALDHPLAAARFSAAATAVGPGGRGRLSIVVVGVGREDVTLTIDPAQTALARDAADPGVPGLLPPPAIGLVDANADLLDGLYAPARIAPGRIGALGIPCEPPPATGGLVRVGGRILLLGPWPSLDVPADAYLAAGRIA
jgi:hypothetical protein